VQHAPLGDAVVPTRRRRTRVTVVTLALLLSLAACGSSPGAGPATTTPSATTAPSLTEPSTGPITTTPTNPATTTTTAPVTPAPSTAAPPNPTTTPTTPNPTAPKTPPLPWPAPEGDAFYVPPSPLPAGAPGDIIWRREIKAPKGATSWLVLYLSEDVHGEPVAVSATVTAPSSPGVDRPIIGWGHGTTGVGDQCASSKSFETGTSAEALLAAFAVGQGQVFAATDYEGLGTPGVHTYLVGISQGQALLDSIRAAQHLAGTGASPASKAVVWGHSQGGQSAGLAADLAPVYAPDANVVGAVVGSPAAELEILFTGAGRSPAFGLGFFIGAGFGAAYPQLNLNDVFTPAGLQAVEQAKTSCNDFVGTFAGKDPADYLTGDVVSAPGWEPVLKANSPGMVKTPVPLFVYHGEADEVIPVVISKLLLARYCAIGDTAYRKTYPGATHAGVVPVALGDIAAYINDRLAGKPAPTSC
jgi:pimeloyl-ACP methyl ester carboxylesterase